MCHKCAEPQWLGVKKKKEFLPKPKVPVGLVGKAGYSCLAERFGRAAQPYADRAVPGGGGCVFPSYLERQGCLLGEIDPLGGAVTDELHCPFVRM